MNYIDFLEKVISRGTEAAWEDYKSPDDHNRLVGAIDGFNACRGKNPAELQELLQEATRQVVGEDRDDPRKYWEMECRRSEIEWVCNVVSAALIYYSSRKSGIITPTGRGLQMAARILNGEGCILVEDEIPYSGDQPAM